MIKVWMLLVMLALVFIGLEFHKIVPSFDSNESREVVTGALLILTLGVIVFSKDPLFIGLCVMMVLRKTLEPQTGAEDELEVQSAAWGIFQP